MKYLLLTAATFLCVSSYAAQASVQAQTNEILSLSSSQTQGTCTCIGKNGAPYIVPGATKGDCDGLIKMGRQCTWTPATPPGTAGGVVGN